MPNRFCSIQIHNKQVQTQGAQDIHYQSQVILKLNQELKTQSKGLILIRYVRTHIYYSCRARTGFISFGSLMEKFKPGVRMQCIVDPNHFGTELGA